MVIVLGRSPAKLCGQELSKWRMAAEVRQDPLEDGAYLDSGVLKEGTCNG